MPLWSPAPPAAVSRRRNPQESPGSPAVHCGQPRRVAEPDSATAHRRGMTTVRLGGAIVVTACLLVLAGCGTTTTQSGQSGSVRASTTPVVTQQRIDHPVTESADGRVLHTQGYAGGCQRDVRLSATERAGEVILKLQGITRSGPPCPTDARWLPVQVTLPKPMDHQALIDGTSGQHLHIQGIWHAGQRSS